MLLPSVACCWRWLLVWDWPCGVLALPVLLAVVGLIAVRGRHRWLLVVVMVVLVAFCVLALASIGLFYLPAAIALIIAVVGWPQPPARPWAPMR